MKFEEAQFNFSLSITGRKPFLFGILTPSSISFLSLEPFKYIKKLKSDKESFLTGNFRQKDGKIFGITDRNGILSLLYLSPMKILRKFSHSGKKIYSTSFSEDCLTMISGGDSGMIRSWDISEQKCIYEFKGGEDTVRTVSYFPGDNCIIGSSSYDGKIRLFDLRCRKKINCYNFGYPVESFRFFPNQRILVGIGGNLIKFWDLRNNSVLFNQYETSCVLNISSPNQKSIIYSTLGKTIKFVRTKDFNCLTIGRYGKKISNVEFFDKRLFIGFVSGEILVKNRKNQELNFFRKKKLQNSLVFAPNYTNGFSFFQYNFLPPLRIPQKKILIEKKEWIGKNFNQFSNYRIKKRKILISKFNRNIINKHKRPNSYTLLSGYPKLPHFHIPEVFRDGFFYEYENKKILYKHIISDNNTLKKFQYFFFKFSFLKSLQFGISKKNELLPLKNLLYSLLLENSLDTEFFL